MEGVSPWEGRPQNDLYCVGWGVKLYSVHCPLGRAFGRRQCPLSIIFKCPRNAYFGAFSNASDDDDVDDDVVLTS